MYYFSSAHKISDEGFSSRDVTEIEARELSLGFYSETLYTRRKLLSPIEYLSRCEMRRYFYMKTYNIRYYLDVNYSVMIVSLPFRVQRIVLRY